VAPKCGVLGTVSFTVCKPASRIGNSCGFRTQRIVHALGVMRGRWIGNHNERVEDLWRYVDHRENANLRSGTDTLKVAIRVVCPAQELTRASTPYVEGDIRASMPLYYSFFITDCQKPFLKLWVSTPLIPIMMFPKRDFICAKLVGDWSATK